MSKRPKCCFKDCNNEVMKGEYTKRLLSVCKECFDRNRMFDYDSLPVVTDPETIRKLRKFFRSGDRTKTRIAIISKEDNVLGGQSLEYEPKHILNTSNMKKDTEE